ncbi:MAG: flagellar basal body L-ring protein FlgH [Alphaproteobacteria bacterium]|nr:flagellar basal body L-ring protein FlgH [Alphaproteobacteria bacterium]
MKNIYKNISLALILTTSLSACGAADRLASVGKPPVVTQIENPANVKAAKSVQMPMPPQQNISKTANSLWSADKKSFFKDQRAGEVGDILTVMIDIDDKADIENQTKRTRSTTEDADFNSFFGVEGTLGQYFPEGITGADIVNLGSTSRHDGKGSTEREEEIKLQLAAVVTQQLPNGNLVIVGRQEVRVNFEKRVLELAGIIRPEDITINNTISYEKIAEARISYGGKGQITDVQQPRYGQQVYDILFPF